MDKQVAYLDGEGFVHRATLQSIEPGGWTADDLHENDGQNVSNDPRMLGTLNAIYRSPKEGGLVTGGLVYRYDVGKRSDGLVGE